LLCCVTAEEGDRGFSKLLRLMVSSSFGSGFDSSCLLINALELKGGLCLQCTVQY
jgi:hypothetical protein